MNSKIKLNFWRYFLTALAFISANVSVYGQVPVPLWQRAYGNYFQAINTSLAPVAGGGVIGSYRLNPNSQYFRVDAGGNPVWSFTATNMHIRDIEPTPDGGYIIAGQDVTAIFDLKIFKIDVNGNTQWTKTYGGNNGETCYNIVPFAGGYYFYGETNSSANGDVTDVGRGANDVWILKTDLDGNKIWDHTYGGSAEEWPANEANSGAVCLTAANGLVFATHTLSPISGDITLPRRTISSNDIWLVEIDANGAIQWQKRYTPAGATDIKTTGLISNGSGGYILGVDAPGSGVGFERTVAGGDLWLVNLEADGDIIWDKGFPFTWGGLTVTADGPLLTGSFLTNKCSIWQAGYALNQLDYNGNSAWTYNIRGNSGDFGQNAVYSNGYLYLFGFSASGNACERTVANAGAPYDAWLIKTEPNAAPNSLTLSNNTLAENNAVNFSIGNFSATDPNTSQNAFTYTLVNGAGADDNASFNISGVFLRASASFNYEVKNTYSIRVRVTDPLGAYLEEVFIINVTNINEAPTNITLTPSSIAEGNAINATVGFFATTDDIGDTHTYTFIPTGMEPMITNDNASFQIVNGNELRALIVFDYAVKNSYRIDVRTTDQGGLFYNKTFIISIIDVVPPNQPPTNILLNNTSIPENYAAGTTMAQITSTDPDGVAPYTYALVAGVGADDNASFTITTGGPFVFLTTAAVFDYETKNAYSIRIRVTDAGGAFFEKVFIINVTDVNEGPQAPTDITLSNNLILEHNCANDPIGSLTATDPNSGDTHTFAIVGGADAAAFTVVGSQLRAKISFNFETKSSYEVTLRATDQTNLTYDETFTITILDKTAGNGSNGLVKFVQPAADMPINELNSGYQTVPLWVEVTGAASFPVVVNLYSTGTATYGNAQYPTVGDFYFTAYPTTGIERGLTYSCQPALTLTFTANGVKKINWIFYGDVINEGNEIARLSLSPVTAGVGVSGDEDRTITIIDDEVISNGTLTFDAATPSTSTAEGNSGTKLVPMKVTLSGANSFPVVAQISFTGSTALFGNTYGKDFHLTGLNTSNQLVFTANGTKTFNVVVMGDITIEPDELVNLNLTSPTGGVTFGSTSRTVTIANDDAPRLGEDLTASESSISLYPNPNNGLFNLSVESKDAAAAQLNVYDLNGRLVLSRQNELAQGQNLLEFDLTAEPVGLYFLEIQTNDRRELVKVVVK